MYSGQAVKVMRQRAYAAQLPPTERLSPLQRIMADNRKRDEERLIAERDPAQRAANAEAARLQRERDEQIARRLDAYFTRLREPMWSGDYINRALEATRARCKRALRGNLSLGAALAAMAANDDLLMFYPHDRRALRYLVNLLAEARAEMYAALSELLARSQRRVKRERRAAELESWQRLRVDRLMSGRRDKPPPLSLAPERRTLTLTAPHGPDLCGVPVAA